MAFILVGAIGLAVFGGVNAALRGPHFVDRVTVVNRTPYLLDMKVTSRHHDGWLELGPVSPGERHNFQSVVDRSDRWIFHVVSGSHDGGEFALTKNELERENWQVTIPDAVAGRLTSNGAVPNPNQ